MSDRPAAESDLSGENGFIQSINIDKNVRYDRGIRIWGHHGQAALEDARVCLLQCSATGSEALKNVVLGGINSFVIVDDQNVEEKDLGNNFMVTTASVGKSRAQVVTGKRKVQSLT
jgi:amyloid beta precursor protein binding protein 1